MIEYNYSHRYLYDLSCSIRYEDCMTADIVLNEEQIDIIEGDLTVKPGGGGQIKLGEDRYQHTELVLEAKDGDKARLAGNGLVISGASGPDLRLFRGRVESIGDNTFSLSGSQLRGVDHARFEKTVKSREGAFNDRLNVGWGDPNLPPTSEGPAYKNGILDVTGAVAVKGTVSATQPFRHVSDERYKKKVEKIDDALEVLRSLRGVHYEWRTDEYPEKNFDDDPDVGFIAQEMKMVFPEAVWTEENGDLAVSETSLVPLLVEAIKEQQEMLDEQQEQLEEMRGDLDALQREMPPEN